MIVLLREFLPVPVDRSRRTIPEFRSEDEGAPCAQERKGREGEEKSLWQGRGRRRRNGAKRGEGNWKETALEIGDPATHSLAVDEGGGVWSRVEGVTRAEVISGRPFSEVMAEKIESPTTFLSPET